jgi:hypothetical protein
VLFRSRPQVVDNFVDMWEKVVICVDSRAYLGRGPSGALEEHC